MKLPKKQRPVSKRNMKSAANSTMLLSSFLRLCYTAVLKNRLLPEKLCFMKSSVQNKMMEQYAISWATPWSQTSSSSSHEVRETLLGCGPVFLWSDGVR